MSAALLVFGLLLLWKGADALVAGAVVIARRLRASEMAIGLTLVAVGTSFPELVVNVAASFRGNGDLAIANVLGSNVANVLLILGAAAMLRALPIRDATLFSEIPFSMTAALAVGFLANAHLFTRVEAPSLSRLDGGILLAFFGLFAAYIFRTWRDEARSELAPPGGSLVGAWPRVAVGVAGLALGARWVVGGAVDLGAALGMSETFMGLTVVAVGTSLPELVTSIVAARRGEADLAVGNIVGSNIFNMLWVLGVSALIRPLPFDVVSNADIVMVLAASALLLLAVAVGRRFEIDRREGAFFLAVYFAYLAFAAARG